MMDIFIFKHMEGKTVRVISLRIDDVTRIPRLSPLPLSQVLFSRKKFGIRSVGSV